MTQPHSRRLGLIPRQALLGIFLMGAGLLVLAGGAGLLGPGVKPALPGFTFLLAAVVLAQAGASRTVAALVGLAGLLQLLTLWV